MTCPNRPPPGGGNVAGRISEEDVLAWVRAHVWRGEDAPDEVPFQIEDNLR
jgi:hypothetical protein